MIEQTSHGRQANQPADWGDNTIRFTERMVLSDAFQPLYQEGMGLVEETAAYLDGQGKQEAIHLSPDAAALYSEESMRLTTRLMNIASWLLLQRTLRNGDMPRQQVKAEQAKIRLATSSAGDQAQGWAELAPEFTAIITRSLRLQERVHCLDGAVSPQSVPLLNTANQNPVADQLVLLHAAFGRN